MNKNIEKNKKNWVKYTRRLNEFLMLNILQEFLHFNILYLFFIKMMVTRNILSIVDKGSARIKQKLLEPIN